MKSLIAFALTVCLSNLALAAPCGESDLSCLRRELLQKADEVASLSRQLGLQRQQISVLEESNRVLVEDRDAYRATLKPVLDAVKASQRGWYEEPTFLVSVGLVGGIALTVLSVWALGQLRLQP